MRASTPVLVGPIYLTMASMTEQTDLVTRLLGSLEQCGVASVTTSANVAALARKQAGEEAGAAAAGQLQAIDNAEMVIADVSDADAEVGAAVTYALHKRRVPTLALWRRGRGSYGATLAHPLLTTAEYDDVAEAEAAIVAFAGRESKELA